MSSASAGGFRVSFEGGQPQVREWAGERRLARGVADAVVQGLLEAPRILSQALALRPPRRPYASVEATLTGGSDTLGEAAPVADGVIRLSLGEAAPAEEARRIARHEALHLLLAATMRGGERWNDPELAFADWIVRGLESHGSDVPRLGHAKLLEKLPTSRTQVQAAVAAPAEDLFGAPLSRALSQTGSGQRRLWLAEAALGLHYLEAAQRLEPVELRPLLLDDWLAEYEQYARAVANPPSGAGNLWRLDDAGWSRDALVRLSAAAQALQCDDACAFGAVRADSGALVWKQRGRVRLPLLRARPRVVPPAIHGFRAVLKAIDAPQAQAAVDEAAANGANLFEARTLWPRILARLLATSASAPEPGPSLPAVQVVDSTDSYRSYDSSAAALRRLLGERAGWVPHVFPPRALDTLEARAPLLLVYGAPLDAARLAQARQLAAEIPVRGAAFPDLGGGAAYELVPDHDDPLDPRYREELWTPAEQEPATLAELIARTDEATREGRLTTPLSHMMALMAIGVEECLYAVSDTDRTG